MAVNKVDLSNGENLIDLTSDTVTPSTLVKGVTAHNSKGEKIVGNLNPEGGSGGGIIDVTELPTSGIDENAVYRLTENVQISQNEVYITGYFQGTLQAVTLQQYFDLLGVTTIPNIYAVDDLSNMLETDVQTFSVVNAYILKSDGIAYIYSPYIPVNNGIATVGFIGFQEMGYDKGFTENIYAETEEGIYTTLELFKEVVRYFVRENGEWEEITAHIISSDRFGYLEVLSGEYLSDKKIPLRTQLAMPIFGDIINGNFPEIIPRDWFVVSNGSYTKKIRPYCFYDTDVVSIDIPDTVEYIRNMAFAHCNLNNIILPKNLRYIDSGAFYWCYGITSVNFPKTTEIIQSQAFAECELLSIVTFEGTPRVIDESAFYNCNNLTTINVPWSEGDPVNENAPWGAENATINYNYTEG